jgi:hypothetical protein
MTAPERFAASQIPLASRAPSIHDPERKSQLVCWSVTNDTSEMAINIDILKALVEDELARMADARVTNHIRSLLIEPNPVLSPAPSASCLFGACLRPNLLEFVCR